MSRGLDTQCLTQKRFAWIHAILDTEMACLNQQAGCPRFLIHQWRGDLPGDGVNLIWAESPAGAAQVREKNVLLTSELNLSVIGTIKLSQYADLGRRRLVIESCEQGWQELGHLRKLLIPH